MKLQFIGTGAADFDWSRYGEKNISGSCATLIDDHILIDCGTTTAKALERFNIDADKITTVVITHNHSDHFDPAVLEKVAKGRKLRLCGSTEVCQKVQHLCETFPLHYGEKFSAGEYEFTALPANHPVEDPNEETFIYIINEKDTDFDFYVHKSIGRRGDYVCYYYMSDVVEIVKHSKETRDEYIKKYQTAGVYSFYHNFTSKDKFLNKA